jgi:two-component system sensor histidine kinase HydH
MKDRPTGWGPIRADVVDRMFARQRLLVVLMFESMLVAICLRNALAAKTPWLRDLAIAQIAAVVLTSVFCWHRPVRYATVIRWALTSSVIATTGGPTSPLVPLLVLLAVGKPSILERRLSLILTALSVATLWAAACLAGHGFLASACASLVLLGGHQLGVWIRQTSDETLVASLAAHDEALRAHRERFGELARLQERIANDLNNPIASIQGLVGLAELAPARAGERLAVLQKEVSRMQLLLDEHLSFARLLTPLVGERVDLYATVVWMVWLHDAVARERQLRFELSHVARVEVWGERRKLQQILMHLVVNAIEASPRGATVELAARRSDDHVRIVVLDDGAGMDPALLECACEPGISTKQGAAGLGLTIARALIEQHGGTLTLRNRDRGGLAAEIELPVEAAVEARPRRRA